ncbi:MAG: EamA family transporter [Bacillota bacterium]
MPLPPTLLLISVSIGALGQLFLKIGASQLFPIVLSLPQLPGTLARVFGNPWVLAGTLLYITSMVTWLKVLSSMELSTAYPMVSLGYVLVMLFSFFFLGEQLTFYKLLGTFAVIAGVLLIGHQ